MREFAKKLEQECQNPSSNLHLDVGERKIFVHLRKSRNCLTFLPLVKFQKSLCRPGACYQYVDSEEQQGEMEKLYRLSGNPDLQNALYGPDALQLSGGKRAVPQSPLVSEEESPSDFGPFVPAAQHLAGRLDRQSAEMLLVPPDPEELEGMKGVDVERLVSFMRASSGYRSRGSNAVRIALLLKLARWVLDVQLVKKSFYSAGAKSKLFLGSLFLDCSEGSGVRKCGQCHVCNQNAQGEWRNCCSFSDRVDAGHFGFAPGFYNTHGQHWLCFVGCDSSFYRTPEELLSHILACHAQSRELQELGLPVAYWKGMLVKTDRGNDLGWLNQQLELERLVYHQTGGSPLMPSKSPPLPSRLNRMQHLEQNVQYSCWGNVCSLPFELTPLHPGELDYVFGPPAAKPM